MASIQTEQKKILVYGLAIDSPERKRLAELSRSHSIVLEDIQEIDLKQKLGYLAGIDGFTRDQEDYLGEALSHSIIWFVSVPKEELSQILQEYSQTKDIKSIDLKSVLTEHNINWSIDDHYEELLREHKMMNAYTFIFHAQKALENMNADEYETESYLQLKESVTNAIPDYLSIQKGIEVEQEILDTHIRAIQKAYKSLLSKVEN